MLGRAIIASSTQRPDSDAGPQSVESTHERIITSKEVPGVLRTCTPKTPKDEFTVNIPAVLAAVVLSTLPLVVLYMLARRQLMSGLTAGFNK